MLNVCLAGIEDGDSSNVRYKVTGSYEYHLVTSAHMKPTSVYMHACSAYKRPVVTLILHCVLCVMMQPNSPLTFA